MMMTVIECSSLTFRIKLEPFDITTYLLVVAMQNCLNITCETD